MNGTEVRDQDEDLADLRRDLCRSLRQYREAAGLTQNQAAGTLEWSKSKFIRVELGTTSVNVTDVRAMLRLYGVTDEDEIARLAAAARRTWLRPEAGRKKKRFAELVHLADGVTGVDGCPFTAEELSQEWEVPPQRVSDALEAVQMLRGSLALPVLDTAASPLLH